MDQSLQTGVGTTHGRFARAIKLRAPKKSDASEMWQLVDRNNVLDSNSPYCYMLLASHFRDTCIVAERDDDVVGMVTGYRRPDRPEAAFLWQIGLRKAARGHGLGLELARAFLAQDAFAGVRFLETTVTPSNAASKGLFKALARELDAPLDIRTQFAAELFPEDGDHEPELLFRIGPFDERTRREAFPEPV